MLTSYPESLCSARSTSTTPGRDGQALRNPRTGERYDEKRPELFAVRIEVRSKHGDSTSATFFPTGRADGAALLHELGGASVYPKELWRRGLWGVSEALCKKERKICLGAHVGCAHRL